MSCERSIDEATQLQEDAYVVLGYGNGGGLSDAERLWSVFAKLEIRPLDPDAVQKYMAEKKTEANRVRNELLAEVKKKPAFHERVFLWFFQEEPQPVIPQEWAWEALCLNTCLTAKVVVPDTVLKKAIALKREFPQADFHVLKLKEDPIMRMKVFNKEFYIDVWDETDFVPVAQHAI